MCAVGCLIKDEFYSPELEGQAVGDKSITDALTASGVVMSRETEEMLDGLQYLHDSVLRPPREWPEELRRIAHKHGLKVPA
jgi:hypothetical protein